MTVSERSLQQVPLLPLPVVTTIIFFGSMPFWSATCGLSYYLGIELMIWSIYAMGYNLLLSYTGLPSFGHGAYFGLGAYALGLVQKHLSDSLAFGLAGAFVIPAFAATIVASFISHRRGIYYALMTIAFGQILWFMIIKWRSLTHAEDGLLGLKRPDVNLGFTRIDLNEDLNYHYFCLVLLATVMLLCWRLIHAPLGTIFKAIKQNELRARFIGYNTSLYKAISFILSAGIAGLAGGLLAMNQFGAFPEPMSLHQSGFIVMAVLIGGGLVSFTGPIVGAIIFILARDVLGKWEYTQHTWALWYGLLFVAIVLFQPEGIAGLWQRLLRQLNKFRSNRARPALAEPAHNPGERY